ncbi:AAC(3) family N-acetyltransferase [Halobaculum marinum]|uniref:AAC(3) family N-acetyltransferase n=1 Tax=Halobaculum marinum TaxID=3031996 RepID=A0ABD5WTJ8_9EURY|nr:AAC(3) family N-acetyltransferase [Halobaculum sp. DT55]
MRRHEVYAHAARSLVADWLGTRSGSTPDTHLDSRHLGDALDGFDADTVVVYAGLSDLAAAFGGDPYELLRDALTDRFETVLTPGFTFSFRETGHVDLDRAPPEVGTFGERFLDDAAFRTADPVFSLLGLGRDPFDSADAGHSYAPGGYWDALHDRDALYLNVGTGRFRCSVFHVAEYRHDVPYVSTATYRGRVTHEGETRRVVHRAPVDDHYRRFARRRVCDDLGEALVDRSVGGVRVQGCRASDVDDLLDDRLAADPYYLVT